MVIAETLLALCGQVQRFEILPGKVLSISTHSGRIEWAEYSLFFSR
jgi:hypothetical protein